jgi:uncharacterized SAM-binding protein YcdF (DUF218 family)
MRLTSAAQQKQADKDGLAMFALSAFIILITGAISWVLASGYCWYRGRSYVTEPTPPRPILVLGYRLWHDQIDTLYRQRLQALLRFDQRDITRVILLGGVTTPNRLSEAQAGRQFLVQQRSEWAERIVLEDQSRNTLENLKQAKQTLYALGAEPRVALLSHRYHLPRCELIAKQLGFDAQPVAADVGALRWLDKRVWMEGFFIHWYLSGLVFAKLIRSKRMLAKLSD